MRAMWRVKSRKLVPISEMSDSHIRNAIAMAGRAFNAELAAAYSMSSSFNPDGMASYVSEQAIERLEELGPAEIVPGYDDLLKEAAKRGIEL
jgi:hypothetical protein